MMIDALTMLNNNLPNNAGISRCDGVFQAEHGSYRMRSAFQPIYVVTSRNLQLFAYEALVRPEFNGTPIFPSDMFEQNSTFDLRLIDRHCRYIHIRNFSQLENKKASLFLNINPAFYNNADEIEEEVDLLVSELNRHGITPERVVCEIIETEAISDEIIQGLCANLRQVNIPIAVDDYGSDHSDWDRFDLVSPDVLKLDGPVFRNLCKTPGAGPVLKTLTTSLNDIGCVLLVEGVENRNQFDIAMEAGVTLLQGYFLAKPETAMAQFPQIPSAAFLPAPQELHYMQVFQPTIPFHSVSDEVR